MPTYENANEALPALMHTVLTRGTQVESRNGLTKELLMQQITLRNPVDQPEITVPGRNVSLPAQIAETMWLLAGRNDIEWLSHYLPRAADFSDDGKTWRGGYGPRIRQWLTPAGPIDQLQHVVDLLKVTNPDTRRAVIQIYNPFVDTEPGKDIPCNNWVHFIPRNGVLHAHVAIRSNDLMWGWSGINSFEWTALLAVVAGLTELQPGSLTFSISSLHLYEPHWAKAQRIVDHYDPTQDGYDKANPGFWFHDGGEVGTLAEFDDVVHAWFQVEQLIREGSTYAAARVDDFPEPMLRSWLQVLLAWHRGSKLPDELHGTSLAAALHYSPMRKVPVAAVPEAAAGTNRKAFTQFASKLHAEKHAAYGNSWKKRGEMLGIMANCARKVDRLGVAGGGDSSADTAIDLLMYLIKYNLWLEEQAINVAVGSQASEIKYTEGDEHVARVDAHLQHLQQHGPALAELPDEALIAEVHAKFDRLEHWVEERRTDRNALVLQLIQLTYPLAVRLWAKEQQHLAKRDAMLAGNATRPFTGYAAEGEA